MVLLLASAPGTRSAGLRALLPYPPVCVGGSMGEQSFKEVYQ